MLLIPGWLLAILIVLAAIPVLVAAWIAVSFWMAYREEKRQERESEIYYRVRDEMSRNPNTPAVSTHEKDVYWRRRREEEERAARPNIVDPTGPFWWLNMFK